MILAALGFVFGAWLLQQQAVLPVFVIGLQAAWMLVPVFGTFFYFQQKFLPKIYRNLCNLALNSLLGFVCGFIWATNFAAIRLSDDLPKEWQQKSITLIGVVASLPEVTEHGERFRFDVEKILTSGAIVPQHISLNFYKETESAKPKNAPSLSNYFHAAERWQFTVRLKRPHGTYNPHGFDFEVWALAENMRATGSIYNKSGYKKLANFVWQPSYLVGKLREKIGNNISQALANKPYAGVIRALVVGDDSQISKAQWDVFFRTGIGHLVSISGLHITMLAGLAFSLVAFIWRRIPNLVLLMPTRKAATIAGLVAAIIYALLAGMSVPTQRTLFMLLAFAAALLLGKNLAISRALAIAVLVVVIIDPWAVIAPGFWLSFGAVALITYVTVGRLKAPSAFKTAIHTQWAITLGLLPLLIVMFGQASIISPIANAFAIPVISFLVVPLSILGGVLQLDFVLNIAHFILQICMQGLVYFANLPTWQQPAPPIWALFIGIFGVPWLLLPRGFPQRWLGFILLLPLFFVQLKSPKMGEMQVSVLDVGQGLSVVIQTKNHTLLYDAGPSFSAQSDAGSRIIVPFLRGLGIKKLDGFMISHNDSDHSGGAAAVLAQLPVGWLASSFNLLSENPPKNKPKKSIKCFAGQHWRWDNVNFEVLYPSVESYDNAEIKDNNRSCVLKVSGQFGSLLLTGDIEKEAENALLAYALQPNIHGGAANRLKSDVIIAPHHGSKTSSTIGFVQAVGAKQVIFTVGYLNRFKHPKPLIENRFKESGAFTYRSDYAGAIILNYRANKPVKIEQWRNTQHKYWHDNYD